MELKAVTHRGEHGKQESGPEQASESGAGIGITTAGKEQEHEREWEHG